MATNLYEALFILDSNQFAREHEAIPKGIEEMIRADGGEVLVSRLWEERKLAYPIKNQRKGTYWLIYFRSEGNLVEPLNRKCELQESILRQLVIKIHPHLEETILAHASGELVKPVAAAEVVEAVEAVEEIV